MKELTQEGFEKGGKQAPISGKLKAGAKNIGDAKKPPADVQAAFAFAKDRATKYKDLTLEYSDKSKNWFLNMKPIEGGKSVINVPYNPDSRVKFDFTKKTGGESYIKTAQGSIAKINELPKKEKVPQINKVAPIKETADDMVKKVFSKVKAADTGFEKIADKVGVGMKKVVPGAAKGAEKIKSLAGKSPKLLSFLRGNKGKLGAIAGVASILLGAKLMEPKSKK